VFFTIRGSKPPQQPVGLEYRRNPAPLEGQLRRFLGSLGLRSLLSRALESPLAAEMLSVELLASGVERFAAKGLELTP